MLGLITWLVVRNRVQVNKACLTGIALLLDYYLDTNERRLVCDHVNKTCMWNRNRVLVVFSAHAACLLPQRIFSDDDGPSTLFRQIINNAPTSSMQVVIHL